MCYLQGTLLELLCDVVDSSSRQGKSLVVCDFPRDLRWAEEFEAKVRKFTVICILFFMFSISMLLNMLIMLVFQNASVLDPVRHEKKKKPQYHRVKVPSMNAAWTKAVSNAAAGSTADSASVFPWWQVGKPSAVILLRCSVDTMSRRLQARRRSTLVPSDRDRSLHRRAESFCSDSQALISHYGNKSLLHTVGFADQSPRLGCS